MVPITTTLMHGMLICIPFTIFVLITFCTWPRLWLHSLPPDIIALAEPKTEREKSITKYILLPVFLLILPGLSVASVFFIASTSVIQLSLAGIFLHIYLLWILVHLWDLIVIDGIAMLLIDKKNPPIRGTEGASGWKNYHFHFQSFLMAVLKSSFFVVPVSGLLYYMIHH